MNTPLKYFTRENYFSKITYIQISEETRKGKHKEMEASENSILAIKKNPNKNQKVKTPTKTLQKYLGKQSRKYPFSQ